MNAKNIKFPRDNRKRLLKKLRFTQTPFEGKTAAVYVRVSSDMDVKTGSNGETEKRASITVQTADGIAYAQKMGWSFKVYDADCNISGSEDIGNRPALSELVKDIEAGKVHTVIVRELKRLFRSASNWQWFCSKILIANGVNFKSLSENIDIGTSEGKLLSVIMGQLGENELVYTAHNSMASKQNKMEAGTLRTTPPFGYGIMEIDGVRKGYVKEAEAATIRELFDRCASGDGLPKLLASLHRKGVKTKHGSIPEATSVLRWLRNPMYKGLCRWNGEVFATPYPPIVSADIWDKVQLLINSRADKLGVDRRLAANAHLLTGLLKCGYCYDRIEAGKTAAYKIYDNMSVGYNATAKKVNGKLVTGKYSSYCCQTRFKHKIASCPESISLKGPYIESIVREWVGAMVANITEKKHSPNGRLAEIDKDIADISNKIESLEARRKKAIAMYTAGTIEDKDLADITASVKRETAKAEASIKDLQEQRNGISNGEQEKALIGLAKWDSLSMSEKKAGLATIFDRLLVYKDKLVIAYRWNPSATFSVPLKHVGGTFGGARGYELDQVAALEQLTRPASGGLSMVGLDDLDKVA